MRRALNVLIFLVMAGALLFVAWKANILPNPLERNPVPSSPPTPTIVQREELRVAVPERPEKLILLSLQKLLQVENLKLVIVPYDPQTVWMELANGEIDLAVVPVDEAVKAQGRFQGGHFLFFSGLSVGLDQLIAWPEAESIDRVAVQSNAATDFLARQMIPEAQVVPAASAAEVEAWLKGKAVEAAMIDISSNTSGLTEAFKVVSSTSQEAPMPSVVVLSRSFSENADAVEYTARRNALLKAVESWAGLVAYLDSRPELLRTTLRKEAQGSGIDVDILLANYAFLSPGKGRLALLEFHETGSLKTTLDLLVLSGVTNLEGPDWSGTIESPQFLQTAWVQPDTKTSNEQSPLPQVTMTPEATSTPESRPTPQGATDETSVSSELPATYNYPQAKSAVPWPDPLLEYPTAKALDFPPALSSKQVAVAAADHLNLQGWNKEAVKVALSSSPTTAPLSDGRNFFYAVEGKIASVNSRGKEVWQHPVKGKALGSSTLVGERLVYVTDQGEESRIICLDPLDGEVFWEVGLSSPPASGPVVGSSGSKQFAVVLNQAGEAKAWNLQDGSEVWTQKLAKATYLSPAIGFSKLAISQPEGKVSLFSLADGSQIWEADLGSPLVSSPTVTDSGVLLPSKDTYLYQLSTSDGSILWKTRLSQTVSEPAVVFGNRVLQSDENGKVHILQLRDGQLLSDENLGSGWLSRVVAWDERWALLDSKGQCRVYGPSEP